jgi:hypothetical protein
MAKDLKTLHDHYHSKATSTQELHPDAGALGHVRTKYQEKQRAGHGLHNPRGGLAETRSQYVKKQTRRDHGTK